MRERGKPKNQACLILAAAKTGQIFFIGLWPCGNNMINYLKHFQK